MPREFRHLVMTNIRRIAHPPGETECIERLLLMQVVLVCVAHAAQKTWYATGTDCEDPDVDVTVPYGLSSPCTGGTGVCGEGPAGVHGIPLEVLWECIAGKGERHFFSQAGPVFPVDRGPGH
jgi:hypothetical protein